MDTDMLKSMWKMWITTCRRSWLLFLCQLVGEGKTTKNRNNEKIFTNFMEISVQMTEKFFGQILLTSAKSDRRDVKRGVRNERRLALIQTVLFRREEGGKRRRNSVDDKRKICYHFKSSNQLLV